MRKTITKKASDKIADFNIEIKISKKDLSTSLTRSPAAASLLSGFLRAAKARTCKSSCDRKSATVNAPVPRGLDTKEQNFSDTIKIFEEKIRKWDKEPIDNEWLLMLFIVSKLPHTTSVYNSYYIEEEGGCFKLRFSGHNAKGKYLQQAIKYKIGITFQSKDTPITFEPHVNVFYKEHVYFTEFIDKDLLKDIMQGVIDVLNGGWYNVPCDLQLYSPSKKKYNEYFLNINNQPLKGTTEHDNAYYRARIAAIQKLQDSNPSIKKFLQNGFVPADRKNSFEKFIEDYIVNHVDNSPLTFTELMTYNTWYEQHPEKVAGTMVESSSFYFPVLVKGTKKDVEKMFEAALSNNKTKTFRESVEENGDNNESKPKYKVGDKFALRAPLKTNKKSILYIEVVGVKKYEDLHPNVQLWQKAHRNEYFYLMSFSKDSTLVYSESRLDKYFELVGTSETSDDELEMLELEAEALELELEISKK